MIVFFVRKINDIDHMAPVIHRAAREAPVHVICLSPRFDVASDYRLRFLASTPGVTIQYQFEAFTPTVLHRMLAWMLCSPGTFPGRARTIGERLARVCFALAVRPLFDRVYPVLLRRVYHDRWAEGLLRRLGATLLVFDWAKAYQHNVGAFQEAGHRLGLRTVALPHGVVVYTGALRSARARRTGKPPDLGSALEFDAIVVPHQNQADYFVRCGVPSDKVHVLGSARFSGDWVRRNLEISPALSFESGPRAPGTLRIVMMDKPTANLSGAVGEAITAIAARPNFELVVRPATRNESTTLTSFPPNVRVSRDSSAKLIEWCDVVIGTTSSILFEPLIQGKPLVCPMHFSGLATVFTDEGAAIVVHSTDELMATLDRLAAERDTPRPASPAIRSLLTRVVGPDDRTLDRYQALLDGLTRPARA